MSPVTAVVLKKLKEELCVFEEIVRVISLEELTHFYHKISSFLQHMLLDHVKDMAYCILKYVDLIDDYTQYTSEMTESDIERVKHFCCIIGHIPKTKSIQNAYVQEISECVLKRVSDPITKLFVATELLMTYNKVLQNTAGELRHEILAKNKEHLYRLTKQLYACGDYELQIHIMEVFRMCSSQQFTKCARDFFPKSEELGNAFLKIEMEDFDRGVTIFLNVLNSKFRKVLSLRCNRLFLNEIEIFKTQEELGESQLWMHFNRGSNSVAISCNECIFNKMQLLNNDNHGSSVSPLLIEAINVEKLLLSRLPRRQCPTQHNLDIHFHLKKPLVTCKAENVKAVILHSPELEFLEKEVLPVMFSGKFKTPSSPSEVKQTKMSMGITCKTLPLSEVKGIKVSVGVIRESRRQPEEETELHSDTSTSIGLSNSAAHPKTWLPYSKCSMGKAINSNYKRSESSVTDVEILNYSNNVTVVDYIDLTIDDDSVDPQNNVIRSVTQQHQDVFETTSDYKTNDTKMRKIKNNEITYTMPQPQNVQKISIGKQINGISSYGVEDNITEDTSFDFGKLIENLPTEQQNNKDVQHWIDSITENSDSEEDSLKWNEEIGKQDCISTELLPKECMENIPSKNLEEHFDSVIKPQNAPFKVSVCRKVLRTENVSENYKKAPLLALTENNISTLIHEEIFSNSELVTADANKTAAVELLNENCDSHKEKVANETHGDDHIKQTAPKSYNTMEHEASDLYFTPNVWLTESQYFEPVPIKNIALETGSLLLDSQENGFNNKKSIINDIIIHQPSFTDIRGNESNENNRFECNLTSNVEMFKRKLIVSLPRLKYSDIEMYRSKLVQNIEISEENVKANQSIHVPELPNAPVVLLHKLKFPDVESNKLNVSEYRLDELEQLDDAIDTNNGNINEHNFKNNKRKTQIDSTEISNNKKMILSEDAISNEVDCDKIYSNIEVHQSVDNDINKDVLEDKLLTTEKTIDFNEENVKANESIHVPELPNAVVLLHKLKFPDVESNKLNVSEYRLDELEQLDDAIDTNNGNINEHNFKNNKRKTQIDSTEISNNKKIILSEDAISNEVDCDKIYSNIEVHQSVDNDINKDVLEDKLLTTEKTIDFNEENVKANESIHVPELPNAVVLLHKLKFPDVESNKLNVSEYRLDELVQLDDEIDRDSGNIKQHNFKNKKRKAQIDTTEISSIKKVIFSVDAISDEVDCDEIYSNIEVHQSIDSDINKDVLEDKLLTTEKTIDFNQSNNVKSSHDPQNRIELKTTPAVVLTKLDYLEDMLTNNDECSKPQSKIETASLQTEKTKHTINSDVTVINNEETCSPKNAIVEDRNKIMYKEDISSLKNVNKIMRKEENMSSEQNINKENEENTLNQINVNEGRKSDDAIGLSSSINKRYDCKLEMTSSQSKPFRASRHHTTNSINKNHREPATKVKQEKNTNLSNDIIKRSPGRKRKLFNLNDISYMQNYNIDDTQRTEEFALDKNVRKHDTSFISGSKLIKKHMEQTQSVDFEATSDAKIFIKNKDANPNKSKENCSSLHKNVTKEKKKRKPKSLNIEDGNKFPTNKSLNSQLEIVTKCPKDKFGKSLTLLQSNKNRTNILNNTSTITAFNKTCPENFLMRKENSKEFQSLMDSFMANITSMNVSYNNSSKMLKTRKVANRKQKYNFSKSEHQHQDVTTRQQSVYSSHENLCNDKNANITECHKSRTNASGKIVSGIRRKNKIYTKQKFATYKTSKRSIQQNTPNSSPFPELNLEKEKLKTEQEICLTDSDLHSAVEKKEVKVALPPKVVVLSNILLKEPAGNGNALSILKPNYAEHSKLSFPEINDEVNNFTNASEEKQPSELPIIQKNVALANSNISSHLQSIPASEFSTRILKSIVKPNATDEQILTWVATGLSQDAITIMKNASETTLRAFGEVIRAYLESLRGGVHSSLVNLYEALVVIDNVITTYFKNN